MSLTVVSLFKPDDIHKCYVLISDEHTLNYNFQSNAKAEI